MIARASRVLPGMLVSVMLAGSLLAAPSAALADTTRKSAALEQRRPSPARAAKPSSQKTAQRSPQKAKTVTAARRRASPAPAATTAFVDDGFSYTDTPGGSGWKQTGLASWYGGSRWQGQRTSSGSRYDENGLTAAHATLPLGSKVTVRRADSPRAVVVTITDRPGTRSRIIDLSRGAAGALGMLDQGVALVTLSPGG